MLDDKRAELLEIVRQCLEEIHTLAPDYPTAKNIANAADDFFDNKRRQISSFKKLALLDGLIPQIWQHKDDVISKMDAVINPPAKPARKIEDIQTLHRQYIFPAKVLKSEGEIDSYVENIRANMKQLLKGHDGIKIS